MATRSPPGSRLSLTLGIFAATRLAAVLMVPSGALASDEGSYLEAGTRLAFHGTQDLFWPPMTGWLIALAMRTAGTPSLLLARVLWHVMDLAVFLMLPRLVRPLEETVEQGETPPRFRLCHGVALAYATYVPAIGFATFATSEMPALVLICAINLVLLRRSTPTLAACATAGALAALLTLTRTGLGFWVVALPGFILLGGATARHKVKGAAVAALCAVAILGGVMFCNRANTGRFVLGTNAYHNLYIGNDTAYQEDLDLFHPTATLAQIAYRARYRSGEVTEPDEGLDDRQRLEVTVSNISQHPLLFLRRATGRLARVLAPKTEELDLLGGEGAVSVRSPRAIALLVVTNLEWGAALWLGLCGIIRIAERHRDYLRVVVLNLFGAIPLSLLAISKPRYSFPFEIFFIIAALYFLGACPASMRDAWGRHRRGVVAGCLALVWAWVAWGIFAVTSRPPGG